MILMWMPKAQDLGRAQDEEVRNRRHIDWVIHDSDLAYVNGNEESDPHQSYSGPGAAAAEAHGVDPQLRLMGSNPQRDAIQNLRIIARHLAAIPGHKSLVWVSSDNVLADWSSQTAAREDKGSNFVDPLAVHAREALNEARVSIYPLDASQLEAGVISADLQNRLVQAKLSSPNAPAPPPNPTGRYASEMHQNTHAIAGTFRDLAEATGGRTLRRSGEIAAELNGIVADGRAVYFLSFSPDTQADDTYHRLMVKVAGRRDVSVRYRSGYLYSKEPATFKGKLNQAIWDPAEMNEIGISATPKSRPKGVALKLRIAATDLALSQQNGRWTDKVYIIVVERDDSALQANVSARTWAMRLLPATYEKALHDGIVIDEAVSSAEGRVVRVIVVDENSGRMGTVSVPASAIRQTP